jgi:hypothetical protein
MSELDASMTAETVVTLNVMQDVDSEETQHRYNLKPNCTPNYSHQFTLLSVASSIKKWGEKARFTVFDEFKMLLDENVFEEVRNPSASQKE